MKSRSRVEEVAGGGGEDGNAGDERTATAAEFFGKEGVLLY